MQLVALGANPLVDQLTKEHDPLRVPLEHEVTLASPEAAAKREESDEPSKREKDLEIYL